MSTDTVYLCCEGATCNTGIAAADRETALLWDAPTHNAGLRDNAHADARSAVSKQLAVTPHAHSGSTGRGQHLYRCIECGHERIYGTNDAGNSYYYGARR